MARKSENAVIQLHEAWPILQSPNLSWNLMATRGYLCHQELHHSLSPWTLLETKLHLHAVINTYLYN